MLVRAADLLEDGEWHDYEQVIRELAKMVPPGRALRHAEKIRKAAGNGRNKNEDWNPPEQRVRARSREQIIATGARSIARSMIHHKDIEIRHLSDSHKGPKQIRMLRVPHSVQVSRLMADNGTLFQPETVVAELLRLSGPKAGSHVLDPLNRQHLERVIHYLIGELEDQNAGADTAAPADR